MLPAATVSDPTGSLTVATRCVMLFVHPVVSSPLAAAREPLSTGWSSSGLAETHFLHNGNALPMYALFASCLVVFLVGMHRALRGTLGVAALREVRLRIRGGWLRRLGRHALLQRRIFRRGVSGLIHLPIFWGFVVLTLGSTTLMVDAYLLPVLGLQLERGAGYRIFQAALDLFGLAFVIGIVLAIYRRWRGQATHEPTTPGALPLLLLLLWVGVSGFALEGLRIVVEEVQQPWSFAGAGLAALLDHRALRGDSGMAAYMALWWCHVGTAFGLIALAPFTSLRHVLVSPLNILISAEQSSGSPRTPFLLQELIESGRFDAKTGADSITELPHRERLGLVACADSGNCQDACPAYAAGTPLSPRHLVRTLRQAASDGANGENRSLLSELAGEEAGWAGTFCGACASTCPTLVDPARYVIELRRSLVAHNRVGAKRSNVLASLSRTRNPYGAAAAARENLASELGVATAGNDESIDVLYWLGCAATFDPRVRRVAQAMVTVLDRAGLRCKILGADEACCGEPARRIGEEGLFQELALANLAAIKRSGAAWILTHCAHCYHTLRNEYRELDVQLDVRHHTQLLRDLVECGTIRPGPVAPKTVTLHDSCYIGRFNGDTASPRTALRSIPGTTLLEMGTGGDQARCCGGGGANYWYDVPHRESIAAGRVREAKRTGADVFVTECPFCLKQLGEAAGSGLIVRDVAEVVAEAVEASAGHD